MVTWKKNISLLEFQWQIYFCGCFLHKLQIFRKPLTWLQFCKIFWKKKNITYNFFAVFLSTYLEISLVGEEFMYK